jgi:hypothetical protein
MVTCWDDANRYPSTHGPKGKPIDVIARYRRDLRVEFSGVVVGQRRNADHQWIRATYTIDGTVPAPERVTRHNCPECGRRHRIQTTT